MGAMGGASAALKSRMPDCDVPATTVPVIRDGRLLLRPHHAADARAISDGMNRPEIAQWMSSVPFPFTLPDVQGFLQEAARQEALVWAICVDDVMVGQIGVGGELGYWLLPQAWGHGYATWAATLVLEHHFHAGRGDVYSGIHPDNASSGRVLDKLGFVPIGRMAANFAFRRAQAQRMIYCLTPQRWQSLRAAAE